MSDQDGPYWRFTQYPLEGKGAIDKWRKKCRHYDDYAEIEFEIIIKNLSSLKRESWSAPEYKTMANWDGIGELRFQNTAKKPLRVFGFHREEVRDFVMLAGAVEDNKKYDPADIRGICIRRKKDIELDRQTAIDFDFSNHGDQQDDDEYFKSLFGIE